MAPHPPGSAPTPRATGSTKSRSISACTTRGTLLSAARSASPATWAPREKSVDHELIAAGHPDIYFELDSFMSVMPPHWKDFDKDPWLASSIAMGVGPSRAIARAAEARRARIAKRHLARIRGAGLFRLPSQPDRRQGQLAAGAWLSRPPSRQSAMEPFALRCFAPRDRGGRPASAQQLRSEVDGVYALVTALNSDRKQIAAEALSAAQVADGLAQRLAAMHFDQPTDITPAEGHFLRRRRNRRARRAFGRAGHHGARFAVHRLR